MNAADAQLAEEARMFDQDLKEGIEAYVHEERHSWRAAMRKIVKRWQMLRKRGEVIEDGERAWEGILQCQRHIAAIDRWLKKKYG